MKTLPTAALFLTLVTPIFSQMKATPEMNQMLEKVRARHELPALGSAVIVDGELKAIGAVGMRKFKGKEPVTVADKWHIGSCTKSMTATLVATFVEEGKLKWESTVGEILGRKVKVGDAYKDVTLKMLVSNRSGIPGSASLATKLKARKGDGKRDIAKRRLAYVEDLLGMTPEFDPGSKYAYSNSGFVVAGAMLEVVAGKSWEELMRVRIFEPLGMKSAGFGGAAAKRKEDQPWGHHAKNKPQSPGPGDDNPDVLGPAGTVHCSLSDLAAFVKMHATHQVGPVLKKAETFEFLQTVAEGNEHYACGWVVMDRKWAKGPAVMHNGSNTMNYCVIWMAPARKFALIAVTNIGEGDQACDEVASALIERYLKGGDVSKRASPFEAVRWKGDLPEVEVGGAWYQLVSLDGIAAEKIIGFAKKEHGDLWQRRFEEDLVELLEGMGHEPKRAVDLSVRGAGSDMLKELKSVEMSEANRNAIRAARRAAEK